MSLLNHLVPTSMFLLIISILLIPDLGTGMVVPPMAGTCPPDTQMCLDGSQCYPKAFHCDGKEDCEDGTDEFECKNEVTDTCIDKFSCKDGNGCVELSKMCDKVEDCADGSDESNCTAAAECEDINHFRCGNGKCITIELQCNEIDDCGDMSDEQSCTKIEMNCTEDEFVCPDGTCLSRYRVCDGYPNCHDGSDERGPCNVSTTSTNVEATTAGTILTTVTPAEAVELANATAKPVAHEVCPEHTFQCLSSECIPFHKVCDGNPDCTDESDETECTSKKDNCDGFVCTNGECIPREWECDAVKDCADNSDEEHCVQVTTDTPNRKTREPNTDRIFEMRYEILKQERIQQEHLYQLKVKELDLKIQTANVELDAAKKWRTAAWDKVDQQAEVHRLTVLTLLKNATVSTHEIDIVDPALQQSTTTTVEQ